MFVPSALKEGISGGFSAFDANTGSTLWSFTTTYGIWSTPTMDPTATNLYVDTGNIMLLTLVEMMMSPRLLHIAAGKSSWVRKTGYSTVSMPPLGMYCSSTTPVKEEIVASFLALRYSMEWSTLAEVMVTSIRSTRATFRLPGRLPQIEVSSHLLPKRTASSIQVEGMAVSTPLMQQVGQSCGVTNLE